MKYAWYSESASKYGTSFYATPDGGEVEVTAVATEKSWGDEYHYKDKVYLGMVTHWSRPGKPDTSTLRMSHRSIF